MCLLIFLTDSKWEMNIDAKNPPQQPCPCVKKEYMYSKNVFITYY